MGGSWGPDRRILFAADLGQAIYSVSANGGERTAVRSQGRDGYDLRWPSFLPSGRRLHLFGAPRRGRPAHDACRDLHAAARIRPLLESESNAQVAGGRLLFVRQGRLFAQPFDESSSSLSGSGRAGRRARAVEPVQPVRLRQFLGRGAGRQRCWRSSARARSIATCASSIGRAAT